MYAIILTWVWWLISAYLRVIRPMRLAEGNSDLARDWVMLIIKERASGPDSERDTYILCGSICHATYVLNGRATIIDMSYRLFTWESYHALYLVWEFATGVLHGRATMKLSTRKCKRFTWDLRPCVHKFYLYCTITTHSIPDCSRPALLCI